MKANEFKQITTPDLYIRLLSIEDTKSMLRLSKEPSLGRWIPDQVYENESVASGVLEYLTSQYSKLIAPQTNPFVLGVCLKTTDELIGHIGLSPLGAEIEIGYAISEKYCNKGYATQIITAISDWAVSTINLDQIIGIVVSDNTGSARVLEKSGFKLKKESLRKYQGELRLCKEFHYA